MLPRRHLGMLKGFITLCRTEDNGSSSLGKKYPFSSTVSVVDGLGGLTQRANMTLCLCGIFTSSLVGFFQAYTLCHQVETSPLPYWKEKRKKEMQQYNLNGICSDCTGWFQTCREEEAVMQQVHLPKVGWKQPAGWLSDWLTARHVQSLQQTGNRLLCILIMRRSGQGLFASVVLHVIKHAPDA